MRCPSACNISIRRTRSAAALPPTRPLPRPVPRSQVQRLFLIAHLNSHAMGPTHTAIFPAAARVSHSCQPNLLFRGAGRTLTYTALTDIPVGRVLSFSYLSEAELVQATALRRAALQSSKLFHCTCPRCVGPDRAAPMPCPACGSNFCVRRDTSPRVFQLQDLDASASASASPTASAEPWVCEDCDATFPDEAFSEGLQRLEALAPRVQRCARALEEADDAAAAELYEELAEAFEEAEGVSRVHWVTVMAARLLFHLTANCGGCDEGDAGADAEEGAGADALCGSGLAQGGDAARPCDAPPAPNGALDADAPPRARDSETGTSLCADRSAPPDSDQDPLEGVPGADDTASGPGDGVGEDHAHYRALVDAFMEYALPDCPFVVSQWHMFAITLYLQLGLEAEAMPRIVSHGPELEALWGAADPDVAQMMRLLQ